VAFRGTFDYSLDAKNRLTVPAKFRAALSDGVVLSKGLDACVDLWRPAEYDARMTSALQGMNPLSTEARRIELFFSANAFATELDSAGRVMVPPPLIDHAGLSKDVVVVGAGQSMQIWDRQGWADFNTQLTSTINDITAQLGHPA
jgi:MraZ protein